MTQCFNVLLRIENIQPRSDTDRIFGVHKLMLTFEITISKKVMSMVATEFSLFIRFSTAVTVICVHTKYTDTVRNACRRRANNIVEAMVIRR